MSERVELKILELLGSPTESPYGNPIPGLEELGAAPAESLNHTVNSIVDLVAAAGGPVQAVIRRLGEPAQVDAELLLQLKQAGIVPGAQATIAAAGSHTLVTVEGFGGGLELPAEIANHIFVVV